MIGQELKILFREDKAYLTTDRPMTFQQLNLPPIAKSFKEPAFWTIKVLNYREAEKKIFCEIISYHVGETQFEQNQKLLSDKLNDLQIIAFKSIYTDGLLSTLKGWEDVVRPNKYVPADRTVRQSIEYVSQPYIFAINETFFVPLKNVRFILGGVSFDKKFAEHKETLNLTIPNDDILEEFDAIKNYFANVLQTKKIQVTVRIEVADNKVTFSEAKSPEIAKIDKQLFENVKLEHLKSIIKRKLDIEINKNLFTMDEYFDTFADDKFKPNTFYNSDKELLENILTISNSKHYKHLRFLSSKHAHNIMKLRFVHHPFSFIFLIQGDNNYHIVWETLNTEEATYVWHITKDINVLKMTLRKIDDVIKVIKVQGKIAYISSTEDQFKRIYHDYSDLVEGFSKWKGELESILI